MLHGHVHNTRENTFLLRWREEIRNACTERHHVRGQFINVGCMMPWMDYQPRTLAEIIEREEAASHALRLWNKQGRISNLLHPISHLPDRYMAASFFPADVSQICAEIWHEHPSKIGVVSQSSLKSLRPRLDRIHAVIHYQQSLVKFKSRQKSAFGRMKRVHLRISRHTQGVALACHHKPGQPLYLFPSFLFVNLNVDVSSLAIVGLSNMLDSKGREDIFGSSPVKRTHGAGVAATLVGS